MGKRDAFYWFKLEQPRVGEVAAEAAGEKLPSLEVAGPWDGILHPRNRTALERILPDYLRRCRWFGGKARPVRSARIIEAFRLPMDSSTAYLAFMEIQYAGGVPEKYLLPLAFAPSDRAAEIRQTNPSAAIAQMRIQDGGGESEGILFDALSDGRFCKSLLDAIARRRRFKAEGAEVLALPSRLFQEVRGPADIPLEPALMKREQSNSSVIFGDRLILKIFRRLQEGINPDLEIGRFVTEKTSFSQIPPLAGALEYRGGTNEPITIGVLQGLVPNQGDAWRYTLDSLRRYFEDCLTRQTDATNLPLPQQHIVDLVDKGIPIAAQEMVGAYLASAELLGRRTGEFHVALASDPDDPLFAPEPFTPFYRRSLFQSMRTLAKEAFSLLAKRFNDLPNDVQADAAKALDLEKEVYTRLRSILDLKITGMRTRHHGDYHLGQVLYTGKDFVITDFEGEPARAISERRLKRSPLRDVAGMLRSFNYAAVFALKTENFRPEDVFKLNPWSRFWSLWVSVGFLKSYIDATANAGFLPKSKEELKALLDIYILEKAVYELSYELNNRPDWAHVPIRGIVEIVQPAG